MTIKDMVGEKLYINTDFTEDLEVLQNKADSLNGSVSSPAKHPKPLLQLTDVTAEHQLVPYKAAASRTPNVFAKSKCAQWPWHGELRKAETNCQAKNAQSTNAEHNCVNPHMISPSCPKNSIPHHSPRSSD